MQFLNLSTHLLCTFSLFIMESGHNNHEKCWCSLYSTVFLSVSPYIRDVKSNQRCLVAWVVEYLCMVDIYLENIMS